MKKIIVLLLMCLTLTSCTSNSDAKIQELQKEVEALNVEIAELKEQLTTVVNNHTTSPTQNLESTEVPTLTVDSLDTDFCNLFELITIKLQSDYYADWNFVASCEYAPEEDLILCAKQCASIEDNKEWAKAIATNLSKNVASTGNVIKELANSSYYSVLDIAAQSEANNEDSLIALAKKCSSIWRNPEWAESIAISISNNKAATGAAIKELANSSYYTVLNIVAHSEANNEDSLTFVAKRCASIWSNGDEEWAKAIATNISNNNAVTANVLKELSNSNFPSVVTIAHEKLESMSNT